MGVGSIKGCSGRRQAYLSGSLCLATVTLCTTLGDSGGLQKASPQLQPQAHGALAGPQCCFDRCALDSRGLVAL
jgi:hypothetical protein